MSATPIGAGSAVNFVCTTGLSARQMVPMVAAAASTILATSFPDIKLVIIFLIGGSIQVSWSISRSLHRDGLAIIMNERVRLFSDRNSCAMIFRNPDNVERAFFQHAGEFAGAFSNFQGMLGVIPRDRNRGEFSLFIIVSVVFVIVERELPVGTAIDAQFNRISWFLAGIL